jgi:hypothetical protein
MTQSKRDSLDERALAGDPSTPPEILRELAARSPVLALEVAKNPAAPGAVLVGLGALEAQVQRAKAAHPNLAPEEFSRLARRFPSEFSQNPALALWLLENPDFWTSLGYDAQVRLARCADAPLAFLQWAVSLKTPRFAADLARHPRLTEPMMETLASRSADLAILVAGREDISSSLLLRLLYHSDARIRCAALANAKTPLDDLVRAADQESLQKGVAANPQAPLWLLEKLFQHAYQQATPSPKKEQTANPVGQALARNPACSAPLLLELARREIVRGSDQWTLFALARHAKASIEVLDVLSRSSLEAVRREVADSPRCGAESLARLFGDAAVYIRQTVVRNQACPPEVLARALCDADSTVRLCAARHPQTPPGALAGLLDSAEVALREALFTNPATPPEILRRLCDDPAPALRRKAQRACLRSLAQVPPGGRLVTPFSAASEADWWAWRECDSPLVRADLAAYAGLPRLLLESLAVDDKRRVRRAARRALYEREGRSFVVTPRVRRGDAAGSSA